MPLDPADIPKAMWAEVAPGGSELYTSAGQDILVYRTADLVPGAAEAPHPARVLRGAVPPGGIAGATFYRGRLYLASQGSGHPALWSLDPFAGGALRAEAVLPVAAESEGLDVLIARGGLLHWLLSPVAPGGARPTYGTGHSELVTLVPAAMSRLHLTARHAGRRVEATVRLVVSGHPLPVAGATVRGAGRTARTGADGVARLTLPAGLRVTLRATKGRLRRGHRVRARLGPTARRAGRRRARRGAAGAGGTAAGVRDSRTAGRTVRTPSVSSTGSRPSRSASAKACATSLTGPAGTPAAFSRSAHSVARRRRERRLDQQRAELVAVRQPRGVRREALVGRELRPRRAPRRAARRSRRCRTASAKSAVGGRERLVRRDRRVAVAHPRRHDAGVEMRRGLVEQRRERAVHQRDLDALSVPAALARLQRGERSPSSAYSPQIMSIERGADLQRPAVGLAGDRHQPAHRLEQQVVAGQPRASARRSRTR